MELQVQPVLKPQRLELIVVELALEAAADLVAEALKLATAIAEKSATATAMVKRAVNAAYETGLAEGVRTERALFLSLFGTPDQQEGMGAFVEKRKPSFHRG